MGIFSFLSKRKERAQQVNNAAAIELEEITSRIDPEEGWSDIFLKITSKAQTATSHIYVAKGVSHATEVGIEIEVNSNIGAGFIDGSPSPESGLAIKAVRFKSIGKESDAFIKALGALYGQPTDKGFSTDIIAATEFSLNQQPASLDKEG